MALTVPVSSPKDLLQWFVRPVMPKIIFLIILNRPLIRSALKDREPGTLRV